MHVPEYLKCVALGVVRVSRDSTETQDTCNNSLQKFRLHNISTHNWVFYMPNRFKTNLSCRFLLAITRRLTLSNIIFLYVYVSEQHFNSIYFLSFMLEI